MIALENIFLLNIKYLRFYRWKVLEIKGQNVGFFLSLVVMVSFREAGSGQSVCVCLLKRVKTNTQGYNDVRWLDCFLEKING